MARWVPRLVHVAEEPRRFRAEKQTADDEPRLIVDPARPSSAAFVGVPRSFPAAFADRSPTTPRYRVGRGAFDAGTLCRCRRAYSDGGHATIGYRAPTASEVTVRLELYF